MAFHFVPIIQVFRFLLLSNSGKNNLYFKKSNSIILLSKSCSDFGSWIGETKIQLESLVAMKHTVKGQRNS